MRVVAFFGELHDSADRNAFAIVPAQRACRARYAKLTRDPRHPLESEAPRNFRGTKGDSKVKNRVIIADDHKPFRNALRSLLERERDMELVGACNMNEVQDLARTVHPDVIVVDVRMPGTDGLTTLQRLVAAHPSLKVVVVSATAEPIFATDVLAAGASAYLTKADAEELPHAIRTVQKGGARYLSTEVRTGVRK